jgi:hypothetical protein
MGPATKHEEKKESFAINVVRRDDLLLRFCRKNTERHVVHGPVKKREKKKSKIPQQ